MRITKKGFQYDNARFENEIEGEYGDEVFRLANEYNYEMINAFARNLQKSGVPQRKIEENVRYLYWFTDMLLGDTQDLFVWDNICFINDNWEHIMCKIILKTGDINEKILLGIMDSVIDLYRFIRQKEILDDISEIDKIAKRKTKILEKMMKYNKVRHDPKISEDEKEEIICNLFGDFYWWPFG